MTGLTKQQLAALCGVTVECVSGWCKQGIPRGTGRSSTGKKCATFDRAACAKWFWKARKYDMARRMADAAGNDQKQPDKPTNAITSTSPAEALEQARIMADQAYERYLNAPIVEKSFAAELWAKLSDNYRKIRKDNPDIEVAEGQVIPKTQVEKLLLEMTQAIKNDLLALPGKLSGQLVGLTPGEIQVIIDREVRDVLRQLGKTI